MRTIKGYEKYAVTRDGRVINKKNQSFLKQTLDGYGKPVVNLYKDSENCKVIRVNKIVACTFSNIVIDDSKIVIEHLDGDYENCDHLNLKIVTEGSKEKKSGLPVGVQRSKSGNRYQAKIRVNGVYEHLGMFDNPEDASDAYQSKLKSLHENRISLHEN